MATAFSAIKSRFWPGMAALSALGYTQTLAQPAAAEAETKGALNPKEFKPFKVIDIKPVTPNTYQYRLELPPGKTTGMGVASCLVTRAELDDGNGPKTVIRPYTPVSSKDAEGYMDLVVKAAHVNHVQVYPNGLMSKHFGSLKVGDTIDVKGPILKLPYKPNMVKHVGLIAGGSGITPMIQVIQEILANPEDKTKISLIFANNTEQDIIMKDRLDRLAANYPGRFKVFYMINKGKFSGTLQPGVVKAVGMVTKDTIASFIPGPREDVLVMVCGPPPMMNAISGGKAKDYSQGEVSGALKDLGYTKEQVFKF